MSGVRNLRAMFEQNLSQSERDRSPPGPGGFATPSPSESPRPPLAKVTTSFIAVERDGKLGLWRQNSGDSVSASSRRPSDETDSTTPQPPSERSDAPSSGVATNIISKMNAAKEPIPESPKKDKPSPKKELKGPLLQSAANSDKVTGAEGSQAKMPSSPTESTSARAGDAPNGKSSTKSTATASNSKPASKTAASASTAKAGIRTTKTPVTSKAPATTKAASTKVPTKVPSAKEPTKAAKEPTKPAATSPKRVASKTAGTKPGSADLPQPGSSFVKPKPKSPTRPARLPSSLTTHTASSAQKLGSGSAPPSRRSASRASVGARRLSPNAGTHRAPSRSSVATLNTVTAKAVKHKPSSTSVGRSRPGVGPPPKPTAADQSAAKKDGHVDEGFLARMTRPTQSSAKRSAEKIPLSPPRKTTTQVKKPESRDGVKSVAKTPLSPTRSARSSRESVKSVSTKEQPKTKAGAATATRAETPKPVIKGTAKSPKKADAAPVEEKKTEVEAESSAKDVAAVAKPAERAETPVEATESQDEVSETTEAKETEATEAITEEVVEEVKETVESQPEEKPEESAIEAEVAGAINELIDVACESSATEEANREAPAASQ